MLIHLQTKTLAAIILALALFLLFVLAVPQYDEIKAAKAVIASRRALLDERTMLLDSVRTLDEQVQLRQNEVSKISTFLPEHKQIDEVVSSIQEIAAQSGLQLSSLTTAKTSFSSETGRENIIIGVDAVGTYPSFVNFLKLLEQNLRLYDIFEITAATSATAVGQVNFSLKINAYYLK